MKNSGASTRTVLPPHGHGQRIGLFGGTFNPPHAAHRAVSLLALKRLRLDAVWWLVTPGNPLKENSGLPPLAARLEAAARLADHPRIVATDVEARIGTRFTVDTLRMLRAGAPGTKFVWIMGADSLRQFHLWRRWQEIFASMPIAVVDRGGEGLRALASPAAQRFARARVPESRAARLPDYIPPAWAFLHGLKSSLSSTDLRAAGGDAGG